MPFVVFFTGLCIDSGTRPLAAPFSRIGSLSGLVTQERIPKATESCSPEEAKWWGDVREAGNQFAAAAHQKHRAVTEARREGKIRADEDDGLTQAKREAYDVEIKSAGQKYSSILREGIDRSYRVPLRDRKSPLILYEGRLWYTRAARARGLTGEVRLKAQFRADGTIGEVRVVKGLGYGLDDKAVEAVRQMVFLPAVISGTLATVSTPIEVTFNLQ